MLTLLLQASSFEIFILCVFMLIVCTVCGILSDMIMRDVGFGVAVNGFVVLLGSVLGAWLHLAL